MNTDELPFGADFTERVFRAADAVARRRRHARSAVMTVAIVLLAGASAWQLVPRGNPPRPAAPVDVASAGDTQTEMTDYLFPEAADLSQFSSDYAGAGDDGRALFADDEDSGD